VLDLAESGPAPTPSRRVHSDPGDRFRTCSVTTSSLFNVATIEAVLRLRDDFFRAGSDRRRDSFAACGPRFELRGKLDRLFGV
jgi:hypothetical protein